MSEIPQGASVKDSALRSDVFADDFFRRSAWRSGPGPWLRHALPKAKRGGARRDRTDDLMLAKHALSQLSYGPVFLRRPVFALAGFAGHGLVFGLVAAPRAAEGEAWWAWEDLNFRPHAYQARALTN